MSSSYNSCHNASFKGSHVTLQSRGLQGVRIYTSPLFLKGKKAKREGRAHLAWRRPEKGAENYNNDKRLAVLNDSEKIPRG